ncbi:MAG: RidA family protein [Alphaproteobacteria bacterium]|nr:RidA family protein [Alphaproteobacteria bacterium]
MTEAINPKTVHKPLGRYSHTMKIPANAEWLVISGQVGINAKGVVADGAKRQAEQAYKNVAACLRANKMTKEHLVKLTIYLTDSRYVDDVRASRLKVFGDAVLPTSTLVIVDALAAPEYLVEVEAWAAKS